MQWYVVCGTGIPMRDMVSCCSAGYLEGTPVLDPNFQELSHSMELQVSNEHLAVSTE